MASIAEMLIAGSTEASQKAPDIAGSYAKGAELALTAEKIQQQRAELDQRKQEAHLAKYEKVGNWFDTAAKMKDSPAKKAYVNDFIPKGIAALGLENEINPTSLKMISSDPRLGAYLLAKTQSGELDFPAVLAALNDPEKLAQLVPDSSRFGAEADIAGAVEGNLGDLGEAYKFRLQEQNENKNAAITAGRQDAQRGITNLGDLRKEVTGHPITKDTISKADSYEKIRLAFGGKPSPAGDISGIFAYMKLLDPQSTVREGEQAQARNATGVPEQIRNLYNRIISGENLSPSQRADFLNQSEKLYREQYSKQQSLNKDFENIARSTGIDPKLIFAGTKFKAPPPEKKAKQSFKPSQKQKDIFNSASEVDKVQIIDRISRENGISTDAARKLLGE